MNWKTHIAFGLFVYLGILYVFNLPFDFLAFSFTLIFSIVPDIDLKGSKISRKTFPFSLLFNLFKHRGFFHSGILLAIIYFFNSWMALGYLSHLFLDMLTPGGIMPFYPFEFELRFFFKTSGVIEHVFYFLFLVMDTVMVIRMF